MHFRCSDLSSSAQLNAQTKTPTRLRRSTKQIYRTNHARRAHRPTCAYLIRRPQSGASEFALAARVIELPVAGVACHRYTCRRRNCNDGSSCAAATAAAAAARETRLFIERASERAANSSHRHESRLSISWSRKASAKMMAAQLEQSLPFWQAARAARTFRRLPCAS